MKTQNLGGLGTEHYASQRRNLTTQLTDAWEPQDPLKLGGPGAKMDLVDGVERPLWEGWMVSSSSAGNDVLESTRCSILPRSDLGA
jgi:hypothetical protein